MENVEFLRIEAPIASIGAKQIAVEPSVDPDLGFKMWGGKDAQGNPTKFLAKDKPARIESLKVNTFASSPWRSVVIDQEGNVIPGASSGHFYAGVVTSPTISVTSPGTIWVPEGRVRFYRNAYYTADLVELTVPEASLTISLNIGQIVVAAYNNGTPEYRVVQSSLIPQYNMSDIVPVCRVWYAMGRFHSFSLIDYGNGLIERIAMNLARTQFYQRVNGTGLRLLAGANRGYLVEAGRVTAGATEIALPAFDSLNEESFLLSRTSSSWVEDSVITQWQNTRYNASGGLTTLPDNKWAVNYVYRTVGNDLNTFMLVSSQYYNTESAAKADEGYSVAEVPDVVREHSILVGRIIFQKGATTGTFQDVFTDPWSLVSVGADTGTDEYVKASAEDTEPGHLNAKLTVGAGLDIDVIDVLDPATQLPTGGKQIKIVRTEEITVMTPATVFAKILGDIEVNASNVSAGQWLDVRFAPINFPTGSIESIDFLPVPGSGYDTSTYNVAIYGNDVDSLTGSALWFGIVNASISGKSITLATPFPIVRKKFNWVAFAARGSGRFVGKSVNTVVPASGNDAAVGVISNWVQDGGASWPSTLADTTHNSGAFPYIQFNITR